MQHLASVDHVRPLCIAQIATGIGILTFWLLFYTVGMAPANPPPCYFPFEHSFLVPDVILAIALIAGAVDVLRGGSWGRSVSLVCAGGLLFLGVIDASFNAQNGGFSGPLTERVQAAAISVWCVAMGVWIFLVFARAAPSAAARPGV